jgi:hypothetical protein
VRQVLVTDWEPEEVSLVPIGADPGAGFRFQRATGPQEQKMDETIITATGEEARDELKINLDAERQAAALAERARIREIEKVGRTLASMRGWSLSMSKRAPRLRSSASWRSTMRPTVRERPRSAARPPWSRAMKPSRAAPGSWRRSCTATIRRSSP